MKKRVMALLLCLAICVTFMPTVFFQSVQEVYAAEDTIREVVYHPGPYGYFANGDIQNKDDYYDDITYSLASDGTLKASINAIDHKGTLSSYPRVRFMDYYYEDVDGYEHGKNPYFKAVNIQTTTTSNDPVINPYSGNYKFKGWYAWDATKKVMYQYDFEADRTAADDVELYAFWSRDGEGITSFTVTYDLGKNGTFAGTSPTDVTVFQKNTMAYQLINSTGGSGKVTVPEYNENTTSTLQVVPKPGYTLEGWYVDKELTTKMNFGRDYTNWKGDITLYAKWKEIGQKFTVYYNLLEGGTFDVNGSDQTKYIFSQEDTVVATTVDTTATGQVDYLTTNTPAVGGASRPIIKENAGYKFLGWYEDPDYEVEAKFEQGAYFERTTPLVLYAKWEKTGQKFKLSYELGEHGTFDGDMGEYTLTTDKTVVYKTVSSHNEELKIDQLNTTSTPKVLPSSIDYEFAGWYEDDKFETRANFEKGAYTDRTTDLTLYAKWNFVGQKFKISYDLGEHGTFDGALNDYQLTTDKTVVYKTVPSHDENFQIDKLNTTTLSPRVKPESDDYEFAGWYEDDKFETRANFEKGAYTDRTTDLTLYAKWDFVGQKFKLSYNLNGHGKFVEGLSVVEEGDFDYNKDKTIATKVVKSNKEDCQIQEITTGTGSPMIVPDHGWKFVGWYEDDGFEKKADFTEGAYYNRETDLVLYAKWEENEQPHNWVYLYERNDFNGDFNVLDAIKLVTPEKTEDGVFFEVNDLDMNTFKGLNNFENYDTVSGLCPACGEKFELKLTTENIKYGEDLSVNVSGMEEWNKAGLEKYELRYLNISKLKDAWDSISDLNESSVEEFNEAIEDNQEFKYANLTSTTAPKNVGAYMAMLVPENASAQQIASLLYSNDFFNNTLGKIYWDYQDLFSTPCAVSFFTITNGNVDEKDDWFYENKSSVGTDVRDINITDVTGLLRLDINIGVEQIGTGTGAKVNVPKIEFDPDSLSVDLLDYKEFEELLDIEEYNKIVATDKNGNKDSASIIVESKAYDKEAAKVIKPIVDEDNMVKVGAQNFVVRYLDYGNLQKTLKSTLLEEIEKLLSSGSSGTFDADMLTKFFKIDKVAAAHRLTSKAPKNPGMYIAMLVPEDYKEAEIMKLFYNNFIFEAMQEFDLERITEMVENVTTQDQADEILEYLNSLYDNFESEDIPCAFSFFEITPNPEMCEHVWRYNGPSGVFGDSPYEIIEKALDEYGFGTAAKLISTFGGNALRDLLAGLFTSGGGPSLAEIINDRGLADEIRSIQKEITYDNYDKVARKLNDVLSTIVARCNICEEVETLKCVAPQETKYDGKEKPVELVWSGKDEFNAKTRTYYLSLDDMLYEIANTIEAIQFKMDSDDFKDAMKEYFDKWDWHYNRFKETDAEGNITYHGYDVFLEHHPDFAKKMKEFEIQVVGQVATCVIKILDSCTTAAPVNSGEYIAFTTFENEDGSILNLKDFTSKMKGIIALTEDSGMDMTAILNSLTDTIEGLFQFGVTCYSIKGTSEYPLPDDGDNPSQGGGGGGGTGGGDTPEETKATYTGDIKPAVDWININVPDPLKKEDEGKVIIAREKLDAAKKIALTIKLTADQQKALSEAEQKVINAEKKLSVMKSKVEGLKLVAGKQKVTVKWASLNNDNVSTYKIYRSKYKDGGFKQIKTRTHRLQFVNKKLKSGKRYYYKVRGYAKIAGQDVFTQYSTVKSVKVK